MNEPFVYHGPTEADRHAMKDMTHSEKLAYLPVTITRITESKNSKEEIKK